MTSLSQLQRRDASPGLVLLIVCAGVVLASLDLFIVNVALPRMAADFHVRGLGGPSWVLNAYAIVYASLLVLFGRLADGRAREMGFLLGVAVFTLASAACAAAPSLEVLVAMRVLQAAGAALLTPTSLGLVLATAPAERRQSSVQTWSAVGGLAAALGPVAGGLLVAASWRWVFLVNVPIGLAALVIGWRRLPHIPGQPVAGLDTVGAAMLTASVASLTLGLVQANSWGWGSVMTLASLAAAIVLAFVFVARCRVIRAPLVSPSLFAERAFGGASLAMALFSVSFGAMLLSVVLWCQDVWGWSALTTGLAIAPGPLLVPVFAAVAGRAIPRWGAAPVVAAGCTAFAAGLAWWALAANARSDYVGTLLGGMLLTGVGVGLTLPTLMATAAASLPQRAFATGSAVVSMFRQVGLAVGVAIFVAAVGSPLGSHAARTAFQRGWWILAAAALLAATVAGLTLRTPGAPARRAVDSAAVAA